jgi:hypothetical protein
VKDGRRRASAIHGPCEHRRSRGIEGAHSGRISCVRNVETVRHEALCDRAEVKGLRRRAVAAAWLKLGAAEPGGAGEAGAALTTTGRAGTARRCGSGKRDEKAYERNQCLKSRKSSTGSNLADMGRGAVRGRRREAGANS